MSVQKYAEERRGSRKDLRHAGNPPAYALSLESSGLIQGKRNTTKIVECVLKNAGLGPLLVKQVAGVSGVQVLQYSHSILRGARCKITLQIQFPALLGSYPRKITISFANTNHKITVPLVIYSTAL